MGSKKPLRFTRLRLPSVGDDLLTILQQQLTAANEREKELLRQLAAKDDQIRLVLEEKFFHPVITRPSEPEKANTAIDGDSIVDSTQFPTKGDAEEIKKQDEEIVKARQVFDDELAAIEAEQGAARHYEALPPTDATEMVQESLTDA